MSEKGYFASLYEKIIKKYHVSLNYSLMMRKKVRLTNKTNNNIISRKIMV